MIQPGHNLPQQHPVVDNTGQMTYSSPPQQYPVVGNTGQMIYSSPPQQYPVVGNTGQMTYSSPPQQYPVVSYTDQMTYSSSPQQYPVVGNTDQMTYSSPPQQHPVVGNTGQRNYSSPPYTALPQQHPVVGNTGQMTYSSPPYTGHLQQHPVVGNTSQMTYNSLPYNGPLQQHPMVANTGQMAYPSYTTPSHSNTLTRSVIPSQPQLEDLLSPYVSTQHYLAYQRRQQEQQEAEDFLLSQQELQHQEELQVFWGKQMLEIRHTTDFKNHNLPLARIKKIMKADDDVRMISAEAPIVFAKACELFIFELTMRSWLHTEENKRRTLQKSDVGTSILNTEIFDFLLDVIRTNELKEEEGLDGGASSSGGDVIPMGSHHFHHPTMLDSIPYYYHEMGSSGVSLDQSIEQTALYLLSQPIINTNPPLPPEDFLPLGYDHPPELHEQSDDSWMNK